MFVLSLHAFISVTVTLSAIFCHFGFARDVMTVHSCASVIPHVFMFVRTGVRVCVSVHQIHHTITALDIVEQWQ